MRNITGLTFVLLVCCYATSIGQIEHDYELGETGEMVTTIWIEPGTFMMGANDDDEGAFGEEYPRHQVTITNGFWLGKYEITQEQWEAVVGEWEFYYDDHPNYPAENISWSEVHELFLQGANQLAEDEDHWRLPTESEWEYACRAGFDETRFWWGNDPEYDTLGVYAWYGGDHAMEVGILQPNPLGLYDILGNVQEWVEDDFHHNYENAPEDGRVWFDLPRGGWRIVRGGNFHLNPRLCRPSSRHGESADNTDWAIGFRLVWSEEPIIYHVADLSGMVTDADTQLPIEGALVSLSGIETTTNQNGNFVFNDLLSGGYFLVVSSYYYQTFADNVVLADGENTIDVELHTNIANVSGTITLSPLGEPANGAEVWFGDTLTVADENGDYSFTDLLAGNYRVVVTHQGYNNYCDVNTLLAVGDNEVDIVLDENTIPEEEFELDTGEMVAMIWIGPGSFMMGALEDDPDAGDNEFPRHQVFIPQGFWMSKYEVTQAQWESVVGDWEFNFQRNPNRPAESVSWDEVHDLFLSGINTPEFGNHWRLPTEAEWEYACRAGVSETRYWWGDDYEYQEILDYVWCRENTPQGHPTQPVGTRLPNPWGLYDMLGNVTEWVEDEFNNYLNTPVNGTFWDDERRIGNRIWRGGSANGHNMRISQRTSSITDARYSRCGFRLVWVEQDYAANITIPLQENVFELVSTPVFPPYLDAEALFGGIDHLSIVYQDNGSIFIPPDINTIGNISYEEGYRIFCSQASELRLDGQSFSPKYGYSISAGRWNWLGYPFLEEVPVETALHEIAEQILIVMTDDGRLWIPSQGINTLGNMIPGEGYMVFSNEDVIFQYVTDVMLPACTSTEVLQIPEVEGAPQSTGLPYAVLVHLSDKLKSQNPSNIEVYDGNLLVGKSPVLENNDVTPVITWEGSKEYKLQGFTKGNVITVKILSSDGTVLHLNKSGTFGEGAYADVTLDKLNAASELPVKFTVGTVYPNPFNPSATIPFAIPQAGEVNFALFNVLGQRVFSRTQTFQAGTHSFLFNASDAGGTGTAGPGVSYGLVSGVYFLKVGFDDQTFTQKIMLLR